MKKYLLRCLLVLGLLSGVLLPVVAQDVLTLERREQAAFGNSVLVPQGWEELAPGVFTPDRATLIIQQAAPGLTTDQILESLLPSLLLSSIPEPVETIQTDYFEWTVYQVDVPVPMQPTIKVDMALAADGSAAHLVFLQTPEGSYETYHEPLFLAALNGYAPAGAVIEDAAATPAPEPTPEPLHRSAGTVFRAHSHELDGGNA